MKLKNNYFFTVREDIKDEEAKSGNLLVRSGMIKKSSAGVYMYLPLGYKVIKNIEQIIREEMNKTGALELCMPVLIPKEVYATSGRVDNFGSDVFSLKDRFILMFSFVQIILACIYFIYTYLENEREELNKTRNLFINAMAHEMKTPNAVILNSSEMLIENVNPEKQHKYLKMIEDESKHMNNLLNQMLIYTRTTNSYQLHKQNHNLSTMFEEVLKHYDLESKIITIDIDSKINISCDQQLMMIVFDNLINNAFKYANQKISIVYKQEKIIISNDGSKIENKDINHIFEPLYKADVSRNDTNSTGMGLAIVRFTQLYL